MQLLEVLSTYNKCWTYTLEEEMVKALNMNLTNFIFSWEVPRKQVGDDHLGDQQLDNNPCLQKDN